MKREPASGATRAPRQTRRILGSNDVLALTSLSFSPFLSLPRTHHARTPSVRGLSFFFKLNIQSQLSTDHNLFIRHTEERPTHVGRCTSWCVPSAHYNMLQEGPCTRGLCAPEVVKSMPCTAAVLQLRFLSVVLARATV